MLATPLITTVLESKHDCGGLPICWGALHEYLQVIIDNHGFLAVVPFMFVGQVVQTCRACDEVAHG